MRRSPPDPVPSIVLAIAASAWCFVALGANQAPVITLPASDTIGINTRLAMPGSVSDDSLPADSIKTVWRQIAPDTPMVTIGDSSILHVYILFGTPGAYTLQLSASDGKLTSYDTIIIVVRQPLPFLILAPVQNEQIQIGLPDTIKWQREPTFGCRILYSVDSGRVFTEISNQATGSGVVSPSIVWNVDSSFADSTPAIIKVSNYNNGNTFATVNVLLVKHKASIRQNLLRHSALQGAKPFTKGYDLFGRATPEAGIAVSGLRVMLVRTGNRSGIARIAVK